MPSHPTVSRCQTVLIASLLFSVTSLGFDLAYYGAYSFWVIPAAFLITIIHHIFFYCHLRLQPDRPHEVPRRLTYPLAIIIMAWLAGAALTFFVYYVVRVDIERVSAQQTLPLVGGIVGVLEAAVLGELWRRCAMMSKESKTLGLLNGLTADLSHVRLLETHDLGKQNAGAV